MLSFEGKKELPAPGMLPLVDPAGKESRPVFAGSPTKEGALTRKQWRYNGAMTAQDGKWIFEGTLLLPEPKVTLVYAVPTDAAGWLLKDGERKHRVF